MREDLCIARKCTLVFRKVTNSEYRLVYFARTHPQRDVRRQHGSRDAGETGSEDGMEFRFGGTRQRRLNQKLGSKLHAGKTSTPLAGNRLRMHLSCQVTIPKGKAEVGFQKYSRVQGRAYMGYALYL